MFTFGLFKKVLIADTFAKAVAWGFTNFDTATAADFIVVMLSYTFQSYFDFSGYSDMATGIARMLNTSAFPSTSTRPISPIRSANFGGGGTSR